MAALADLLDRSERKVELPGASIPEVSVKPLTLGDIADLEAWLQLMTPHPVQAILPYLKGLEGPDRAVLLKEAYKDAASWPPVYGSEGATRALLTAKGRAKFLHVALARTLPGLTLEQADELAKSIQEEDFSRLFAIANGRDPDLPKDEAAARAKAIQTLALALSSRPLSVAPDGASTGSPDSPSSPPSGSSTTANGTP